MSNLSVKEIKDKYVKGLRVELIEMQGESQMPKGLQGVVDYVGDIGQIHVIWGNGSTLALVVDEDSFKIVDGSGKNE